MGKAINELDSFAGPVVDGTLIPVAASDTLKKATASQLKTYMAIPAVDATPTNGSSNAVSSDGVYDALVGKAATGAIGSSGLTMATAKLLGRSTAGTGAVEEITLGTNLSFSGTTLNAAGGGGTPGGSDTQVQFNDGGTAFGGDAGLTFNKTTKSLSVGGATVTTSNPVLNATQTWNAGAVTFTGIKLNVTDTASAAASLLADLQVGGVSKFKVDKTGLLTVPYLTVSGGGNSFNVVGNGNFSGVCIAGNGFAQLNGGSGIAVSVGRSSSAHTGGLKLTTGADMLATVDKGDGTLADLKSRNLIGTGNLATGAAAKSAGYTATTSDGTIEVDASGAARTITLFAASGNAGKIIVVKKTDSSANAVTVDGNASETIDGAATISLASQYSTAILQVNAAGTGWNKLGGV